MMAATVDPRPKKLQYNVVFKFKNQEVTKKHFWITEVIFPL